MRTLRVVADTNVYVSIFQFGGRVSEILDLALEGAIELSISQPIIDELRGVLSDKFQWSPERLDEMTGTLRQFCRFVQPTEVVHLCRDPDDDRILECAVGAGAEVIVSGDSDLQQIELFREIRIMSPRQFLDSESWKV